MISHTTSQAKLKGIGIETIGSALKRLLKWQQPFYRSSTKVWGSQSGWILF